MITSELLRRLVEMFVLFLFGAVGVLWYMYHFEDPKWILGVISHILMAVCITVNYFEQGSKDTFYLFGLWVVLIISHWAISKEARNDDSR